MAEYLCDDGEFDSAGRATRDYPHDGEVYTVEEERIGDLDDPDATILRVLDGDDEVVVAATYLNGFEDRTEEEYDGFGEPINKLENADNPLHAIDFVTYSGLNSDSSFSQTRHQGNWGHAQDELEGSHPAGGGL